MTSLKMEIGNNSKSGHLERKKQIIKVLKISKSENDKTSSNNNHNKASNDRENDNENMKSSNKNNDNNSNDNDEQNDRLKKKETCQVYTQKKRLLKVISTTRKIT